MPAVEIHLDQARSNIIFLENICNHETKKIDWMVTVSFYSALHIINAHLKKKGGLEYVKHGATLNAINPYKQLSITKTNQDVYDAYRSLYNSSRIARYLYNPTVKSEDRINNKHFKKAIKDLNTIIDYFNKEHKFGLSLKEEAIPFA